MWKYFLKRVLSFLPTAMLVVLILFAIKQNLPGDPVEDYLSLFSEQSFESESYRSDYLNQVKKMGYDLPVFYLSVKPRSLDDSLLQIIPLGKRKEIRNEILNKGFAAPKIRWYGSKNQFHHWLSSLIRGDFGVSTLDGKNVSSKIFSSLKWTALLALISLVLSISMSIPIGLWLGSKENTWSKNLFEKLSFFIYTIPLFWFCLLGVIFFTSDYYGLKIFPSVGVDPRISSMDFFEGLRALGAKLILPSLCWTLHSLSYATTQLKTSVKHQATLDYVRTAYAKGLSRKEISVRHILKNALLPMITLFMAAIPNAIAGSLVIETIFNIPGMGRLLIQSIYAVDWNTVLAIVFVTSLITMLSFLIADILYAWSNPKIKFSGDE